MLVQEVLTDVPPDEVVRRAREFFSTRFSPYAGFTEEAGESHIRFATEAGEAMIGVGREGDRYLVRGSSSRLHHEISQFLTTLAPAEAVRQNEPPPAVSGAG